ncbi:MAG: hypothetical protein AAF223_07610, partial [Bacteroidota bacterium]
MPISINPNLGKPPAGNAGGLFTAFFMKLLSSVFSIGSIALATGLILFTSLLSSCSEKSVAEVKNKAQITILYDAFGRVSEMKKGWGFAA